MSASTFTNRSNASDKRETTSGPKIEDKNSLERIECESFSLNLT